MITNVSLTITSKLLYEIDRYRGDVPRSRFVTRLLELAMKNQSDKNIRREKTIPVDNSSDARDQQLSIVRSKD